MPDPCAFERDQLVRLSGIIASGAGEAEQDEQFRHFVKEYMPSRCPQDLQNWRDWAEWDDDRNKPFGDRDQWEKALKKLGLSGGQMRKKKVSSKKSYAVRVGELKPGRSTTYRNARGIQYRLYKSKVTGKVKRTLVKASANHATMSHISGI